MTSREHWYGKEVGLSNLRFEYFFLLKSVSLLFFIPSSMVHATDSVSANFVLRMARQEMALLIPRALSCLWPGREHVEQRDLFLPSHSNFVLSQHGCKGILFLLCRCSISPLYGHFFFLSSGFFLDSSVTLPSHLRAKVLTSTSCFWHHFLVHTCSLSSLLFSEFLQSA